MKLVVDINQIICRDGVPGIRAMVEGEGTATKLEEAYSVAIVMAIRKTLNEMGEARGRQHRQSDLCITIEEEKP